MQIMLLRTTILLVSLAILILSFSFPKKKKFDYFNQSPPGTLRVDSNLYIDYQELTNLSWREYMFWTRLHYGAQSNEYLSTIPDTLAWLDIDSCWLPCVHWYLRHPSYNKFPVVGVSYQQAKDYSKWRSDRVFEMIVRQELGLEEVIPRGPNSYFSLERYLSGNFIGIDTAIKYYPRYDLPSVEEWKIAVEVNEKLLKNALKKSSRFRKCDDAYHSPRIGMDCTVANEGPPSRDHPLWGKGICRIETVLELDGNVSELSSEEGIILGANFEDQLNVDLIEQRSTSLKTSAAIGFRNVCRWEEIMY